MPLLRDLVRVALAIVLVHVIAVYALSVGRYTSVVDTLSDVSELDRLRASRFPIAHLIDQLNTRMKPGDCALLFRQSDYAYYGRNCYFSHIDGRLLPLYQAKDWREVRDFLGSAGIRFVYVPAYGVPEFYNTPLESFLADPANASVVWDMDGNRLYEVSPHARQFQRTTLMEFGGEWRLRSARGHFRNTLAHYDWSLRRDFLTTGGLTPDAAPLHGWRWEAGAPCTRLLKHGALRGFEVEVEGRGYLMAEQLESGAAVGTPSLRRTPQLLWDGAISGKRTIRGQFVAEPGQCEIPRVKFSLLGTGNVEIVSGRIFEYSNALDETLDFSRQQAELRGWSAQTLNYTTRSWKWGTHREDVIYSRGHPSSRARTELLTPPMYLGNERGPYPKQTPIEISMELEGEGEAEVVAERLSALQPGMILTILKHARDIADNLGIESEFPPRFSDTSGPHAPMLITKSEVPLDRIALKRGDRRRLTYRVEVGNADAVRLLFRMKPMHTRAAHHLIIVHALEARVTVEGRTQPLYRLGSAGARNDE